MRIKCCVTLNPRQSLSCVPGEKAGSSVSLEHSKHLGRVGSEGTCGAASPEPRHSRPDSFCAIVVVCQATDSEGPVWGHPDAWGSYFRPVTARIPRRPTVLTRSQEGFLARDIEPVSQCGIPLT